MNEEIKNILGEKITVGSAAFPVAHLRYKGNSKKYVVWTIIGERPELSGDDEPIYSTVTVDIDVYDEGNYLSVIKAIKKLMKENEWLWVEDSPEMYEEDTGLYHKTITFMKERTI